METIFTARHQLRNSKTELFGGELVEPFERPSRAEYIINRVHDIKLGPVNGPDDFGLGPILAIHDKSFIDFLQVAWSDWLIGLRCVGDVPAILLANAERFLVFLFLKGGLTASTRRGMLSRLIIRRS